MSGWWLFLAIVVPLIDFITATSIWYFIRRLRRSQRPVPRTLLERAWVATAIWLGVSLVSAAAIIRAMEGLSADVTRELITVGILMPSMVNAGWLVMLVRGRFGKEDHD